MPLIQSATATEPRGARASLFAFLASTPVVVVAIVLATLPLVLGANGGFVFDDYANIVDNAAFSQPPQSLLQWWEAAFSSIASDLGRPLALLSLTANAALTGLDPFWFKLTNILIHGLNGLLLYGLLRSLFGTAPVSGQLHARHCDSRGAAALLALLWTALPIHTGAVLIVVQRMELLAMSFVLLALIVYVRGRQRLLAGAPGGLRTLMVGLAILPALGILAKESATLVPVYALALEVYVFRFAAASSADRRRLQLAYGLAAIAAGIGCAAILPRYLDPESWAHRNFTLTERLLTESRVLWDYLRWILVPDLRSMGLYHDNFQVSRSLLDPPTTALALGAWGLVIALLVYLARRPSLLGLGIAWYLAGHLLTATVFPLELVFEHRNYFAAIGALLASFALLLKFTNHGSVRRWSGPVSGLAVAVLLSISAARAHEWGDPLRFAQAEAARNPSSPRACYQLGRILVLYAQNRADNPYYRAAMEVLERARELPGDPAMPLQAMIIATASAGLPVPQAWWTALQDRLRTQPTGIASKAALQSLLRCQLDGRCKNEAQQLGIALMTAANRTPADPDDLTLYAQFAQIRLGDTQLALALMEDAVKLDPRNPLLWYQWGQGLALAARYPEALAAADQIDHLDRWLRHRSKSANLRQLVADLQRTREHAEAAPPAGTPPSG